MGKLTWSNLKPNSEKNLEYFHVIQCTLNLNFGGKLILQPKSKQKPN